MAPATASADPSASDTSLQPTYQAIGPYLRAVRRHWKLVLLVTLLTAAIATITVVRSGKSYQASASVLVTPLPQSDSAFVGIGVVVDTGDPARTVQTAAALINSAQAANMTAAAMGRGWSLQRVQDSVRVTPLGQSDVLSVTATASSPNQAAQLANAFAHSALTARASIVQRNIATELVGLQKRAGTVPPGAAPPTTGAGTTLATQISQLRAAQASGGDPTLSFAQAAQPPTNSTGASTALVLLLSLLGGFALGSIAALGLDTFSRPVRDEEITSLYPLPVLASIPRIKQARGQRDLAPWSFPPAAFEQMRMLRVQLSLGVVSPVIMVTSAGGGDGKTTVAAALAAAFAEIDEDVILMDLDLRKPDLVKVLGMDDGRDTSGPDEGLQAGVPMPVPQLPRVKVMPAPKGDLARFETLIRRLPDLLAHARRMAGCVIIDTAPVGEVSESLRIAPLCDEVVFVARPGHTDRRGVIRSRELLERADAPTVGMVLIGQDAGVGNYYSYGYLEPNANGAPGEPTESRPASRSIRG